MELLVIHSNTWNHSSLLTCKSELVEIEVFDHLIVYKQMTDVKWNC